MNSEEVERVAATIGALRPDWTNGLPDRHRSLRTFIAEHMAGRDFRTVVVEFVACAADPSTVKPGRVLEDGPWRKAGRVEAASPIDRTTAGERRDQLGRRCVCGVWESHHTGARVQDCPGYTPELDWTPPDPDRIARLRAAITTGEPA